MVAPAQRRGEITRLSVVLSTIEPGHAVIIGDPFSGVWLVEVVCAECGIVFGYPETSVKAAVATKALAESYPYCPDCSTRGD